MSGSPDLDSDGVSASFSFVKTLSCLLAASLVLDLETLVVFLLV